MALQNVDLSTVLTDIETNIGLKFSYNKNTLYRIEFIANTDAKIYTQRKIKWSNEAINTLREDLHHQNLHINFNSVLLKMETVSNMWFLGGFGGSHLNFLIMLKVI